MSNKLVPQTYRAIIDKVIASVRPDFEENGIESEVLDALQASWEAKLAQSRVTDFSPDPRMGAYQGMLPALEPKGSPRSDDGEGAASGSMSKSSETKPKTSSNGTSAGTSKAAAPVKAEKAKVDVNSNELGSDLDESDEDLLDDEALANGEDPDAIDGDVIIALYEKVHRVKNKWKLTLKDGVINADGKDWVFSRCQGDFDW